MTKLSADLRNRAKKELANGAKLSDVAKKFGITPSAASYLKNQATGCNPGVETFEKEFNKQQRDRFERLLLAGESLMDLAKDYETSKAVLQSYMAKHGLKPGLNVKVGKTKKIKITARGNGKRGK